MKKITKGLLGVFSAGAFVVMGTVGCSGVENINNNSNEIIYNGGSVVAVGDYVFYGNGFASGVDEYDNSSSSEYDKAKEYSYLARLKKTDYDGTKYTSSSNVEKISDKIVGYSNAYMFVDGDYIYYATPNMHQTNQNKYIWTYVSIFRSKLDGSKKEEVFTTESYTASSAQIRALSYDGKNYLVIYDGTNLVTLALGKNVNEKKISSSVTGVALPKEGESWNGDIYFTESRQSQIGQTGNIVFKANIKDGDKTEVCKENGLTITFTGRVKNTLFYSMERDGIKETYTLDLDKQNSSFATAGKWFYALEVSDVAAIAENNTLKNGYVFSVTRSSTTEIMYYNLYAAKNNELYEAEQLVTSDYSSTVVVYEENFFYSTSDSIMKVSVLDKEAKTIVSDMSIKSSYFGYDFKYFDGDISRLNNIYFYATRVYDTEAEDYDEDSAKDENYYLYAVDASGVKEAKLFGKLKED